MRLALCVLAAGVVGCAAARADEVRWINPAGGSWTDPSNWDVGRLPTVNDSLVFEIDGAYTVNLPSTQTVGLARLRRGSLSLTGAQLESVEGAGPGGVGFYVGEPGSPATLTLAGARMVHVSNRETLRVEDGSTLKLEQGASVYTSHSRAVIKPGGLLSISDGTFNPGVTDIQGRVVVTGGFLTGEFMELSPSSSLSVDGPTARVQSQEGWWRVGGQITVANGGLIVIRPETAGIGVHVRVQQGGTYNLNGADLDATSSMTVEGGGTLLSFGSSLYECPLIARAGSRVTVAGVYQVAPDLDQSAVVTRGWLSLSQGLTVEIDGLAEPVTPLVPRYGQSSSTFITGPLTVRIRNSNSLRVGDVIPILGHEPGGAEEFSGLVAPSIGGGRVLALTRSGSPAVTSIAVVQGPPSCFLDADFNGDGDVGTDQDIEAFFACLGGQCCAACASSDFNGDGDSGTDEDIAAYFRVLSGAAC